VPEEAVDPNLSGSRWTQLGLIPMLVLVGACIVLLAINGFLGDAAGSASMKRAASGGGPCGWPWARFTSLERRAEDGTATAACSWTPMGWSRFEVHLQCTEGTWSRYGRGGLYPTAEPCSDGDRIAADGDAPSSPTSG